MVEPQPAPAPGIYPGVDFDVYLSWQAVSNSSLSLMEESPFHYFTQAPKEETPLMRFGTMVHAGKFEPASFFDRYEIMPDYADQVRKPTGEKYSNARGTNAYKELVATFKEDLKKRAPDKIPVDPRDVGQMTEILKALDRDARAKQFFDDRGGTQYEVSIVWIDQETGLACKGRVDCLHRGMSVDFKTTTSLRTYEWEIVKRGHHRQGAFYCEGLKVLTGTQFWHAIVAASSQGPIFAVRSAPLDDDLMAKGRLSFRFLLNEIAKCAAKNEWRCYESPTAWSDPGSKGW